MPASKMALNSIRASKQERFHRFLLFPFILMTFVRVTTFVHLLINRCPPPSSFLVGTTFCLLQHTCYHVDGNSQASARTSSSESSDKPLHCGKSYLHQSLAEKGKNSGVSSRVVWGSEAILPFGF